MTKIVYIISPGHSGSTTLTMLLGQIPGVFAAGELMYLPWQLERRGKTGEPTENLTLCTCRKSFRECDVWGKVISDESFDAPYERFQLSFLEDQAWSAQAGNRLSRIPMLVYRRLASLGFHPFFIRPFQAKRIAKRNLDLMDKVAAATGAQVVVDGTKSIVRFHFLNRFRKSKMVIITRDPRGLAASAIKNGRDPKRSLDAWIHRYERFLEYIEANRPDVYWITYEKMCAEPTMVQQFFANLFFGSDAEIEDHESFDFHVVAGNPSRYRPFIVREDTRWKELLPDDIRDEIDIRWHRVQNIFDRLKLHTNVVK